MSAIESAKSAAWWAPLSMKSAAFIMSLDMSPIWKPESETGVGKNEAVAVFVPVSGVCAQKTPAETPLTETPPQY